MCVGVNIKGAVMNHSGSCVACFSDADFILAQLLKLVITVLGSVGDRSRYVTWHLVLSGVLLGEGFFLGSCDQCY